MKDAIMELINALTAGDMQKVIDSFAVILNVIFELVKGNM